MRAGHLRRLPEKRIQADILRLLRTLGAQVWVTGTTRRRGEHMGTRMTPGLPDLVTFLRGELVFIEVKAAGGRLRTEQALFRECCTACHVTHLTGGVDVVVAYLAARGLVREGGRDALATMAMDRGGARPPRPPAGL